MLRPTHSPARRTVRSPAWTITVANALSWFVAAPGSRLHGNFRPTKSQKKSAPIFDDFCRIPIVLNEFALDTIKNNVASLDETSTAWMNVTSLATEQRIYR